MSPEKGFAMDSVVKIENVNTVSKAMTAVARVFKIGDHCPHMNNTYGRFTVLIPGLSARGASDGGVVEVEVWYNRHTEAIQMVAVYEPGTRDNGPVYSAPVQTIYGGLFPVLEAIQRNVETFRLARRLLLRGYGGTVVLKIDTPGYKDQGVLTGNPRIAVSKGPVGDPQWGLHGTVTLAKTGRPVSVELWHAGCPYPRPFRRNIRLASSVITAVETEAFQFFNDNWHRKVRKTSKAK